ncbi:MAG: hypothetical protein IJ984_02705 [Prevotella sp.]|nr:hypothetical protein [Prevotella sp.]
MKLLSKALFISFITVPSALYAADNVDEKNCPLSGSVYTEVNYGHKYYGEERDKWDFPHIVISADLNLGKGWSISGEFEYERFYEDGAWGNDFDSNYATNKIYVNKSWSDALNVKAGIIEVPVGVTNAGGPALTIYDPESEAAILPMSWHEGGAALHGRSGKIDYSLAALTYITAPLNDSRFLGGVAAIGFNAAEGLRIGASGFWGKSHKHKGMIGFASPDFLGDNGVAYAAIDGTYENNGWTASTSLIYCSDANGKAVGAEAGYDLGTLTEVNNLSVIPFVRYDGVFNIFEQSMNKWTVGLNFSIIENLVLKAEYGMRHYAGLDTERTLDLGIGYSIDF